MPLFSPSKSSYVLAVSGSEMSDYFESQLQGSYKVTCRVQTSTVTGGGTRAGEWQNLASGPPAFDSWQSNAWNWGAGCHWCREYWGMCWYAFSFQFSLHSPGFPSLRILCFHSSPPCFLWDFLVLGGSQAVNLSRLGPMKGLRMCFWSLCWVTRQGGAISGWGLSVGGGLLVFERRQDWFVVGKVLWGCSFDWSLGCKMKCGKVLAEENWSEERERERDIERLCTVDFFCYILYVILLIKVLDSTIFFKVHAWICLQYVMVWGVHLNMDIYVCSWGVYRLLEVAIGGGNTEGCVNMHFLFIFLCTSFP